MESTVVSALAGVACLAASYLILRALIPQEGKPPSRWTSTEARSTFVSIVLLALAVAGIGLLVSSLVR
jgi:hypothetical protein